MRTVILIVLIIQFCASLDVLLPNDTVQHFESPSLFQRWEYYKPNQAYNKKLFFDTNFSCKNTDVYFIELLNGSIQDYVYFGRYDYGKCSYSDFIVNSLVKAGFAGVVMGFNPDYQVGIIARDSWGTLPDDLMRLDIPIVELEMDFGNIEILFNLYGKEMLVSVVDGENNIWLTLLGHWWILAHQIIFYLFYGAALILVFAKVYLVIKMNLMNKYLLLFVLFSLFVTIVMLAIRNIDPFLYYGITPLWLYTTSYVLVVWGITSAISALGIVWYNILDRRIDLSVSDAFKIILNVIFIANASLLIVIIIADIIIAANKSDAVINFLAALLAAIVLLYTIFYIVNLIRIMLHAKTLVGKLKMYYYVPYIVIVISMIMFLTGGILYVIMKNAIANCVWQYTTLISCLIIILCISLSIGDTRNKTSISTGKKK